MKICLFIDGDNVSVELADKAIKFLQKNWEVMSIRAYGNWSQKPGGWKELCNKYAVECIHLYKVTTTKNCADIKLAVDATALIHSGSPFDCLAIVSSDADFGPVMAHAQSMGKRTYGLGGTKTSPVYAQACDAFFYLSDDQQKLIVREQEEAA